MQAYVFLQASQCLAAQQMIDASQGYPKEGKDIGNGIHVKPPFVTVTYTAPLEHPSRTQWAIVSDPTVDAAIAGKGGIPVPVSLDATWSAVVGTVEDAAPITP